MKTIDYYIIKKFLGTFFYAISLLIMIVIIFDLSENIDEFISKNAPLNAIIFDYYLNFIPYFINLFSYLFTFISVIYFTSHMAGNSEIIAILSSGISYNRMLRPYFISAILLALLSFYLANFLIPHTNQKRRAFTDVYFGNLSKSKDEHIHLQIEPGTYVYVESFNIKTKTGFRFSLEKYDGHDMKYKLMADRIIWDTLTSRWTIQNYTIREISGNKEKISHGTRVDTTLNLMPSELYIKKENYEEMTFGELQDYIRKEKLRGAEEIVYYDMERHNRLASPFATLVMTLIGVSLSSRKMRGGIGMHLGLGILLTFTYILLMRVTTVFATVGDLPPYLAAWIPNIFFGIIGLYLLKSAPK
ncbi:MAG TPA: LptF/LptG family permease [Bacteroidales bacterium]|nr:LptF/LptG family permease [Bacteroidales bacterium]HOX78340.1 LptF/LptG family permease [Bacteroidales bacterium]HPI87273.1 LptF/LptG family permease [Bacteroidales bacterium]